jgi:hypothetical protein
MATLIVFAGNCYRMWLMNDADDRYPNCRRRNANDVLYQGMAARTFERSFQLADYVQVKGASLGGPGSYTSTSCEILEAIKSRAIVIASSSKRLEVKPTWDWVVRIARTRSKRSQ